jgi:hypothetical protein
MSAVPTRRLRVNDPEQAMDEIRAYLEGPAAAGERPWCEVWYPAPDQLTPDEQAAWEAAQPATFDAVELVDGEIVTLPPYAELEGAR